MKRNEKGYTAEPLGSQSDILLLDVVAPFGLDIMVDIDWQEGSPAVNSDESITWTDAVTEEGDTYQKVDGTAKRD